MSARATSTAVMARRAEPSDSLDDFPTPPWATRALLRFLRARGEDLHLLHAWEPACNRLYMARVLAEEFDKVFATDVHDYGAGQDGTADFLIDWADDQPDVDWIITNPPFRLLDQFALQAIRLAKTGVALFVRMQAIEGVQRYNDLFRLHPPAYVLPFVERVICKRGCLVDPAKPFWERSASGAVTRKMPSTATMYCWIVWRRQGLSNPVWPTRQMHWVAPCRADLTRPGDYPPLPDHLREPEGNLI